MTTVRLADLRRPSKPTGTCHRVPRIHTPVRAAFLFAVTGALLAGCAAPPTRLDFRAERYEIDAHIDPTAHRMVGRTTIDLVRTDERVIDPEQPVSIEFALHRDLKVTRVAAGGADIRRWYTKDRTPTSTPADHDGPRVARTHVLVLDQPIDRMVLTVDYEGRLHQDVGAGEKPGEIHNFAMRAHVGEDGVFLAGGPWYPEPIAAPDAPPALAEFAVTANRPPGFVLIAGAESAHDDADDDDARYRWQSPYPLDGMVLVGGPLERHAAMHNDVAIGVYLRPEQAAHAAGLIDAARAYLDRYEPLIGPYPAREFKIVENFFSSGFAFPTFTLLSSDVINMGERSQTTHGYIDHEVLHGWWGNGVFVDPRDGNWCEALASYGANYYGFVLDGDDAGARKTRRNFSHFLSRIEPEADKPLGTYGLPGGCGRGIAYHKGAIVFHMLAREIGQDAFWSAMRRLTEEYVGRHASWEDIRRVCAQASGQDLDVFFGQWVRGGGAPELELIGARYTSAEQKLTIAISQGGEAFDIDVPIRLVYPGTTQDVLIPMNASEIMATVDVDAAPQRVILDPDYHLFRKVSPNEVLPTTARTRSGNAFASILPAGEPAKQYLELKSIFEGSFDEPGDDVRAFTAGAIDASQLGTHNLLILGEAVHDPPVQAFFAGIGFPVRFDAGGFELEGERYASPAHSVLATFGHPGVPGGGVTVLFANSKDAIPPAMLIPFYDNSLIIFENGKPIVRRDFEQYSAITVDH